MAPSAPDPKRRAFVWLVLAIVLGNYLATRWYVSRVSAEVPEWPIAFDLLLLIPALYLMVFRPPLKRAVIAVAALLSLGIFIGSVLVPDDSKVIWRPLDQVRWGYLLLALGVQAGLILIVLADIARSWNSGSLEQALHDAIEHRLGQGPMAELLKADGRVWLYLVNHDASRLSFDGTPYFGRNVDQNASNQQAFLILVAIEIPVAHLIIHLFSPTAALVTTSLSLYGLLFLYAEYRATLMRPTTLMPDHLHIRHGVLGDVVVAYRDIAAVGEARDRPRRAKGRLRFVGMGSANVVLTMRPGTTINTLFGAQQVGEIYVGLDDAGGFRQQLQLRIDAAVPPPESPRPCAARSDPTQLS